MPDSRAISEPAFQWTGVVTNFLAWVAACVLFTTGIGGVLPFPKVLGVHEKYEHFAANHDRYNLLFVGSSRFYHQIIPARFDADVADLRGCDIRSFNFGVDAMRPPESFYLVRKIVALRPPKLRWIVIEMMEIKAGDDNHPNARTLRRAYWHDWRHTCLAWEDIARSKRSLPEKCDLGVEHGMDFARTALNFGRGVEWIGEHLSRIKQSVVPKELIKTRGFDPLPHKALSPDDLATYQRLVSRVEVKLKPKSLHPLFRKALRELIGEIRAVGIEPIFVITPTVLSVENFAEAPDGARLLAFNDPHAYAALFDPAYRVDPGHLDEEGAMLFTDVLATRVAECIAPAR